MSERAYVTYLGEPGSSPDHLRFVDGMEPFAVGERREFTEETVNSLGRTGAVDFAQLFVAAQNVGMKTPRFAVEIVTDTPTDDTPTEEPDSPKPARKGTKTPDPAATAPADEGDNV